MRRSCKGVHLDIHRLRDPMHAADSMLDITITPLLSAFTDLHNPFLAALAADIICYGRFHHCAFAPPVAGFAYTKGKPKSFSRPDAPVLPAAREFCPDCGVHLVTRAEPLPELVFLKVGTLDDPMAFGAPDVAIFTVDKQPFHHLPDGIQAFDKLAGM